MIKAEKNDRPLVVDLLARSFEGNQSVNYIVRQDGRRVERIRSLMEYSFDVCYLFGEVWLSENKKACALILFPQRKRTSLRSVWLDVKLIYRAIGLSRIRQALKREGNVKKLQPKVAMTYLWFIGVDTDYQHAGTGSLLLKEIITASDRKALPVYLETSTLQNLPWYRRFGFEVYNQLELGYTLFFLKHEPYTQI
ncbi:GNAT family N-acetyltransferase [Mucilaginibacter sp. BJC16-A38]|uniref:GNAT family N-acetyltransferase n=1 Tax=Mucilaginibacter phenanthrenivorans TaxID=1234842 RepID=UPI002158188A|nr:GNAT family N-acetyltransferase [Mucilaginibacter phenanthrenivorans]MCR8560434.1 GNAT family N-acetyltransferase [Mucilaginibacter phenanthrenivorans]